MKKAQLFSVPTGNTSDFVWKWRSAEDKTESSQSFELYYECLADCRKRGYDVELTHAAGQSAPGGAEYSLRNMNGERS